VKISLRKLRVATIILMPAIIIKNPSSVLNVLLPFYPLTSFCKIRPSMAINAINIEAWPSKSLTINSIKLFMIGHLQITLFQE
jgi:hypothetical protein